MATFTVTTLKDELDSGASESAPGGTGLSLREAVGLANASAGADRIEFADDLSGLMRMAQSQINIRNDELTIDGSGRITISGDIDNNDRTVAGDISTLSGNGVAQLSDNVRAFFVREGADTTLIGLTLTGGRTRNEGGHGGAIYSQADITLVDSLVSGNSTSADNAKGGGLFSRTSITLTNSTVRDNSTVGEDSDGGGIAVDTLEGEGAITLSDSEVSGNLTTGKYASGGGVYSSGALTITDSVIKDNRTTGYNSEGGGTASLGVQTITGSRIADNATTNRFSEGGGAFSKGALTVSDSEIAGNKTSGPQAGGGGIYSRGKLTVTSSTITGNETEDRNSEGGGVYGGFSKFEIINSVITGNSTSGDFSGGGGIRSRSSDLYLINTTVTGNSTNGLRADGGGVLAADLYLINSTVTDNLTLGEDSDGGGAATQSIRLSAENSIVLGNKVLTGDGDELAQGNSSFNVGALTLIGQNIIGTGDGALSESIRISDQSTGTSLYADPSLVFKETVANRGAVAGVLADNGSAVQTVALNANIANPALNAADDGATGTDARGVVATYGRDLGAYELITDANLIVTTGDDVLDANDGQISLREAVYFANAREGANTVTFASGVEDTIRLTEGVVLVFDDLAIDGGGRITITGDATGDDVTDANGITDVSASGTDLLDDNSQIFYAVDRETAFTIDGLTLTGGRSETESIGGGAIRANGAATILNSTISGNSTTGAEAGGGGVYARGALTITDSTISRNLTTGDDGEGGGVFGRDAITITRSTIAENETLGSEGYGGGVFADSGLTLAQSTIAYNAAQGPNGYGAGLYSKSGVVLITHSTIVGNQVAQPVTDDAFVAGPGLYADGPITIVNSIIVGNTAASGGPEISDAADGDNTTFIGANIVGSDPYAFDASGAANVINADPAALFADVLADNGGPVQTIALKADLDNPALDASTDENPDARNLPRIDLNFVNNGGVADLGAFELQDQFLFAPTIASAAAFTVAEGRTAVTAITATDDQDGVSFAVTGGADAALFAINPVTGGLSFQTAPDFDAPTDAGANNIYNIEITATDSDDISAVQALTIRVSETAAPTAPAGPTLGDDTLMGTAQNDTINALAGDDDVSGLAGDDLLLGGGGDDSIKGAGGDDRLRGNRGEDTLKGGGGDDNLKGNGGEDVIRGNGGNDVIRAGGAADNVKGGGGEDLIFGGGGADKLNGGGGADTLRGNGGDDTLKGNGGADVFQFRTSDRNDTISDFRQGQDKIEIQNGANSFAALNIEQDSRDVLISFGAGQIRVVTDNAEAFDESDFIF